MGKPVLLVSHQLPDAWLTRLTAAKDEFELIMGSTTAETTDLSPTLRQRLPEAVGLLSFLSVPMNAERLAEAPRLRVVSNMAVGVDNIDLAACTAAGVAVGHTPGVLTAGTADLVMAILLAAARRLPEAMGDARAGRWGTWDPAAWLGMDLQDATLGIVGFGQIGQAVARRAAGFGVRLVYHSRTRKREAEAELGATWLPLADLLESSDFVVLLLPLSTETHHLIDAPALRQMKPSALLINAARGSIVDTDALTTALQAGWIEGAALDVTDPEPLPPDHALYGLPNCLITPHIGSATQRTRWGMAELAIQNLLAGARGERLIRCANPDVYKREG